MRRDSKKSPVTVTDTGYCVGDPTHEHETELPFANSLIEFIRKNKAKSIVDFSCGMCHDTIELTKKGFQAKRL